MPVTISIFLEILRPFPAILNNLKLRFDSVIQRQHILSLVEEYNFFGVNFSISFYFVPERYVIIIYVLIRLIIPPSVLVSFLANESDPSSTPASCGICGTIAVYNFTLSR